MIRHLAILNKEALEDVIDALEENKDALDNEFEANQIGERINEWVTTASQTDELTASDLVHQLTLRM